MTEAAITVMTVMTAGKEKPSSLYQPHRGWVISPFRRTPDNQVRTIPTATCPSGWLCVRRWVRRTLLQKAQPRLVR